MIKMKILTMLSIVILNATLANAGGLYRCVTRMDIPNNVSSVNTLKKELDKAFLNAASHNDYRMQIMQLSPTITDGGNSSYYDYQSGVSVSKKMIYISLVSVDELVLSSDNLKSGIEERLDHVVSIMGINTSKNSYVTCTFTPEI